MTPLQIILAIFLALIPIAAGGLVAFGVVKGKMYNYLTFDQHRVICQEQKDDVGNKISSERFVTNRDIDRLTTSQDQTLRLVSEIHGYLKAKNGGSL